MPFNRLPLFCYLAFILFTKGYSQSKATLLLAEYDEQSSQNHLQHLVKYSFDNGKMISKEEITAVSIKDTKNNSALVRFDIGKNIIYKNRYLITGQGNIVDIKNKKILFDKSEKLAGIEGDSIIYYTNDIFKGKYYSIFNLKTEKYIIVKDANYNPYPTHFIEFDLSKRPFSINYYPPSGKKQILVENAGYGEANSMSEDKIKQTPPVYWLDRDNFIYPHYDKSQKKITIYKVDIKNNIEKLASLDSVPMMNGKSYFKLDGDSNIVYSCGKGEFIIDIKNKKLDKIKFENVGNHFSIEAIEDKNYGRKIMLDDTEIGKKWCGLTLAQTTKGYIAIENELVTDNERYFQGVIVWDEITKKWTKIKLFELATIVGWMDE